MATIDDVARMAGVSKATVSRVLNGTAPVNKATRSKIDSAIEELNYSPSFLAQSMRSKKTRTIGIVIPDYLNPFYTALFKEIEKKLNEHDYMMLICPSDESSNSSLENIKKLVSRQIDGIILFTYKGGREYYDFIYELSKTIPCIFMDQVSNDLPVSQVITDGYNAMKRAVEYLIAKGHRDIGCIKVPHDYEVTLERVKGYENTLSEHGIAINKKLMYEGDGYLESGFAAGEYFCALEKKPTAIVSVTDVMGIGAMKYFQFVGIQVPQQLEIIGFDNVPLCTLVTPPLSSIAQPYEQLASEAVRLLVKKIDNPKSRNKRIVLDGELIIRRSSDINKPEYLEFR